MRGGVEFTPIDVFWDGESHWVANGFHRVEAAKRAGLVDVLANIRHGTKDDAYVFSAGANKEYSQKRTPEDIKKSIEMLFALEEWWAKGNAVIGRHVGVDGETVAKFRKKHSVEHGRIIPDALETVGGKMCPSSRKVKPKGKSHGEQGVRGSACGELIYASSPDELKSKVAEKTGSNDWRIKTPSFMRDAITKHGVLSSPLMVGGGMSGFWAIGVEGVIAIVATFHESPSVTVAVGRVLMAKHVHGTPTSRAVVIGYKANCNQTLFEIAESMGVEFLTPDEFLESLYPAP